MKEYLSNTYLCLIRGINVGGNNRVPMAELKACLEEVGYQNVRTYIASGNVIFESDKSAQDLTNEIQQLLPKKFKLSSDLVKVLILTHDQLKDVVDQAPKSFGTEPNKYHSDAIFLIGVSADDAIKVFDPRVGVDEVWPGNGVIYSQRLSELRTKSRLSKIMISPLYKSMTIRNWNTTTKLLELMNSR